MRSCEIRRLVTFDEPDPKALVKKKIDFVSGAEADEDIRKLIFSCMQCDKCTLKCPKGLYPHLLNYACRLRWVETGHSFPDIMRAALPQPRYSYHNLVMALTSRPSDRDDIIQDVIVDPAPADQVVFLGCVLMNRPDLLHYLLDILKIVGFTGPILMGPTHCCGRLQQMGGDGVEADRLGRDLIKTLNSFRPREVILWCTICYQRLVNYLAPVYPLHFKPVFISDYLLDNIDKLPPLASSEAAIYTYQDPCGLTYNNITESPRRLITSVSGNELEEMVSSPKRAGCCGGNASRLMPEIAAKLAEARVLEASGTGASQIVTMCAGCEARMGKPAATHDMSCVNLIALIGNALGIHHPNRWWELRATKDVDHIINECREAIERSDYTEEEIRRELPRYL